MEQYYVVKMMKKMDKLEAIVEAVDLSEAHAIVKERYADNLMPGETFHIFPFSELLMFDKNHRLIVQKCEMARIIRIE